MMGASHFAGQLFSGSFGYLTKHQLDDIDATYMATTYIYIYIYTYIHTDVTTCYSMLQLYLLFWRYVHIVSKFQARDMLWWSRLAWWKGFDTYCCNFRGCNPMGECSKSMKQIGNAPTVLSALFEGSNPIRFHFLWDSSHPKLQRKGQLVGGDWNMTFIFPYIGNSHPNWLSYFSDG